MKYGFVFILALAACSPTANVSVFANDTYWGGEGPDGLVFTAITPTLEVKRRVGTAFTEDDQDIAVAAAQAHCTEWGATFAGNIVDKEAGLPSFFEGTWRIAGECVL